MPFDVRAKFDDKDFKIHSGERYTVYDVDWVRGSLRHGRTEAGDETFVNVDITFFLIYIPELQRFLWSPSDNYVPAEIAPQVKLAQPKLTIPGRKNN